jgi:hypothetical protein
MATLPQTPTNHGPLASAREFGLALPLSPRAEASQIVDAFFVGRIALELYRADRRDPDADLRTMPPAVQERYRQDAAFARFLCQPSRLEPAFYDAANEVVEGGIGKLSPQARKGSVQMVKSVFRVIRQSLYGLRPAQHARFSRLADVDAQLHAEALLRAAGGTSDRVVG